MNEKVNIGSVTKYIKMKRALWNIFRVLLFRPFGTKLFRPWRVSLLNAFGANIHSGAEVYASAQIWAPWNLTLEEGSCIGPDTIVYNQAMVTLRKNACVSQYAYICTAGHDLKPEASILPINNAQTGLIVSPVVLEEQAWIGTRAFVGMGVTIGAGAIVGACACVFKDVEHRTVVGGNPAQVIKKL